jgi:hypothetical protein
LAAGPNLTQEIIPQIIHGEKRAITWEEHCRIVARERNLERRDFYELCWHLGGSQSDIAALKAEDFDYVNRSFCYARKKTANMGARSWVRALGRSLNVVLK